MHIQNDVVGLIRDFFEGNVDISVFKKALLPPFPQVEGAQSLTDFRPVSICMSYTKPFLKLWL